MITERLEYQIEITASDHVQVRTRTIFLRDGVECGHENHRHVIAPGEPCSNECERVQQVVGLIHTPEVVQKHKDKNKDKNKDKDKEDK